MLAGSRDARFVVLLPNGAGLPYALGGFGGFWWRTLTATTLPSSGPTTELLLAPFPLGVGPLESPLTEPTSGWRILEQYHLEDLMRTWVQISHGAGMRYSLSLSLLFLC